MVPTIKPNDLLLTRGYSLFRPKFQVGDIVLA